MIVGTIIYVLDTNFDYERDEFPRIENVDNALSFNGELTRYVSGGADLLIQNVSPQQERELITVFLNVVGNQFGAVKYKAIPKTIRGIKFV